MAKKKDEVVDVVSAPEIQMAQVSERVDESVLDELDFQELVELENALTNTKASVDKLAGNVVRLKRDIEIYHDHEKTLNAKMEEKRQELIRRYKIDATKNWKIDANSRKVVYPV